MRTISTKWLLKGLERNVLKRTRIIRISFGGRITRIETRRCGPLRLQSFLGGFFIAAHRPEYPLNYQSHTVT